MFDRSKFGFISFLVVVLLFIVGGYFLTDYLVNGDFTFGTNSLDNVVELVDYRIDKTMDYIYFEEREYPISSLWMKYQTITINITGHQELEDELNDSEAILSSSVTYVTDEDESNESLLFNEEGIYSLEYREYDLINYGDYITLISYDYKYDISNVVTPLKLGVYTFDKTTNELLSEEDILNLYDITIEEVKEEVKSVISTKSYADSTIKVSDTMNDFTYIIYINKIGNLEVMYLLNSTSGYSYDTLVIN